MKKHPFSTLWAIGFSILCIKASNASADTVGPIVTWITPVANQSITSPLTPTADISDPDGIWTVELYVDNVYAAHLVLRNGHYTAMNPTTQVIWTTASLAPGAHQLLVRAYDSLANVTVSVLPISIQGSGGPDTTPPTVTWITPVANQSITSPLTPTADISDPDGIWTVELYVDNVYAAHLVLRNGHYTAMNPNTQEIWTTASLAPGAHQLLVRAYDNLKNVTVSVLPITIQGNGGPDTTPPTVTWITPIDQQTLSSPVRPAINVVDSGGSGLWTVELYLDSVYVAHMLPQNGRYEATNPTTLQPWTTANVSSGSHQLLVLAYDNAHNRTSSAVTILTNPNTDTTPPDISWIAPESQQTLLSPVIPIADINDPDGIWTVELYVDSVFAAHMALRNGHYEALNDATQAPWTTESLSAGPHQLLVRAYDNHNNHRDSVRSIIQGSNAPGSISSCQTIRQSGTYHLTSDVHGGSTCFRIDNVPNVTLDCDNHTITADDQLRIIYATNAPGLTIQECRVVGNSLQFSIELFDSANVTLTGNTITGQVAGHGLRQGTISNNVMETYFQENSHQMTITNNVMEWRGPRYVFPTGGGVIGSFLGSNNVFTRNTLDGRWDGTPDSYQAAGTDNGIIIHSENGDVITDNTIRNNWGCSVETVGNISDMVISGNRFYTSRNCGVGAWWDNSWARNTIENNVADNISMLFLIFRQQLSITSDKDLIFEDNVFRNNTLNPSNYDSQAQPSSKILMTPLPGVQWNRISLKNNHFGNNNFNAARPAPLFEPASMIIDDGGNKCRNLPGAAVTLNCQGGTEASTPIDPPTLAIQWPSTVGVNQTLTLQPPAIPQSIVRYEWSIQETSLLGAQTLKFASRSAGPTGAISTAIPSLDLSTYHFEPGTYRVGIRAMTAAGTVAYESETVMTLVASNVRATRVYPNPWRVDLHSAYDVTFDGLSSGTRVKIFTLSGHFVRELGPAPADKLTWNRRNSQGDAVASGIYLYLTTDSSGNQTRGKFAIIK